MEMNNVVLGFIALVLLLGGLCGLWLTIFTAVASQLVKSFVRLKRVLSILLLLGLFLGSIGLIGLSGSIILSIAGYSMGVLRMIIIGAFLIAGAVSVIYIYPLNRFR